MKAYLLYLSTVCGGGERVSLEMAKALREEGLEVIYVTNSAEGLRKCSELHGLPGDYGVIEVGSLLESILSRTDRFIRYRRLLLLQQVYKMREKLESVSTDNLIIDTSTSVPLNIDVSYIHYPITLGTVESKALHWRLYNLLIERRARRVMGKPKLVLVNSEWTAKVVEKAYGLRSTVLHPPVDVEYYAYDGGRKEKIIVTVSRLTPEKKLYTLPYAASRLPDYEWYLVGSTGLTKFKEASSNAVIGAIKREVRRLGVRNFHVVTNMPRRELRNLLLSASFYVHPLFPEHFGIAVAEAMAAGCIPIVYRDGGAWTDIVSPVSTDLGYSDPGEVASIIRRLESNRELLNTLREKAVEHVQGFKAKAFREKFIKYLEEQGIL